jgi:hypothetical protein
METEWGADDLAAVPAEVAQTGLRWQALRASHVQPGGGIKFDEKFFVQWPKGQLPHQVRLQGGDASSDSFCFS